MPQAPAKSGLSLTARYTIVVAVSVAIASAFLITFLLYRQRQMANDQARAFKAFVSSALLSRVYSHELDLLWDDLTTKAGARIEQDHLLDPATIGTPERASAAFDKAWSVYGKDTDRIEGQILYLALLDAEGNVTRSSLPDGDRNLLPAKDLFAPAQSRPVRKEGPMLVVQGRPAENVLCALYPVASDGKKVGAVYAGISETLPKAQLAATHHEAELDQKLKQLDEKFADESDSVRWQAIAGAVIVVLLSIGVTRVISLSLTHSMGQLGQSVRRIQDDWDLTQRSGLSPDGEVGRLGAAFDTLVGRLSELVVQLQQASLQVGSASAELLAASEEISRGAKGQAKHVEDASSAVTEMSASVQGVAANARKAAETARKGGASVNAVIESMNRIRRTVEDTANRVKELGESGKEIGKIVSVITQISDQTSLLALNAAIEAARAGEHGKGFAVVADEVAKLAERASKSAKEIEELIGTIKDKTEEAVQSMAAGRGEVEAGSTVVADTGRHFLEIVDVVQETAASVQEQAKASDEIARIMTEVLAIAKETVTATEEAVAQGNDLRELALRMQELSKKFTTKDAQAAKEAKGT